MAEFRMELAGTVFSVRSLFDSTKDYCGKYLTEKEAEFALLVLPEDLAAEQAALDAEAREEGLKRRKFSDPFLERSVLQKKAADLLFSRKVLMVHGSTVALDGRAYLFTASCGTGKSTHTRFWREAFGSRAVMVNDDKPFLRLTEDGCLACGSPWSGKHGLDTNITVPLAGICILERGTENRIRKVPAEEALPMLLHQSHCPDGRESGFAELITSLANSVPLWQMDCTKDVAAAWVSMDAMSKEQTK